MPKQLADIEEKVGIIVGAASTVQLDIMDGTFVKSRTWPHLRHDMYFEELITQDRGLPFWDQIDYEIDLMVADPIHEAQQWMAIGASRIIAHIEAFKTAEAIEQYLALRNEFVEIALAINIDTPFEKIEPYLKDISSVQCMGIARIGYQGEPFDRRVLDMITKIHEAAPELAISVDGGVSIETAPELIDAGVTRLVSGSAVFGDNPHLAIRELESL